MHRTASACLSLALIAAASAPTLAQVTPVRSSIRCISNIGLTEINRFDTTDLTEEQDDSIDVIGPVDAVSVIDSPQGFFTATSLGVAGFNSANSGSFLFEQSYVGVAGPNPGENIRFDHQLQTVFEYEFIIPSTGTIRLGGFLDNGGPSSISYTAFVQIFAEEQIGEGFGAPFFQFQIFDFQIDGETFTLQSPLEADSGSYKVQIRLSHDGRSQLNSSLSEGSLNASWAVATESRCVADLDQNGAIDFFDISILVRGVLDNDLSVDINGDGTLDFFDVSDFLDAIVLGCP